MKEKTKQNEKLEEIYDLQCNEFSHFKAKWNIWYVLVCHQQSKIDITFEQCYLWSGA